MSFLVFLFFLFPYDMIITSKIYNIINKYNLPISFSTAKASPTVAFIEEATLQYKNNIPLGRIKLEYAPLIFLTGNFDLLSNNTFYSLEAKHNKDKLVINANFNTSNIINSEDVKLDGNLSLKGDIDLTNKKGVITLSSEGILIKTPEQKISLGKIEGKLQLNGSQLEITNIKSNGDLTVNIDGRIFINVSNIYNSTLNIKGILSFENKNQNIYIRGSINNPSFFYR